MTEHTMAWMDELTDDLIEEMKDHPYFDPAHYSIVVFSTPNQHPPKDELI